MNSIDEEPIPNFNISSPQANPNRPESADAVENENSHNDTIVSNSDSQRRPFNCLFFTFKIMYYIYIAFKWCCGGLSSLFCKNRIIGFMTLQMFFVFLRLINVISKAALFWMVLVSIFILLFIMIVYLCIAAEGTSPRTQLQRARSIQISNYQRSLNARRAHALNIINDRLMEQIFLNASPRVNFFVTGPAGGMRLMHLEHDLQDINGTRAQIRMISRGLMRLLAEFIEEQQLQQNRNQRNGLTEEQINALPVEKFIAPIIVGPEEAETCSICIAEFEGEQELRRLPCNHKFHKNCIDEWLKISSCCPNCKAELMPNRAEAPAAQEP